MRTMHLLRSITIHFTLWYHSLNPAAHRHPCSKQNLSNYIVGNHSVRKIISLWGQSTLTKILRPWVWSISVRTLLTNLNIISFQVLTYGEKAMKFVIHYKWMFCVHILNWDWGLVTKLWTFCRVLILKLRLIFRSYRQQRWKKPNFSIRKSHYAQTW